MIDKPYGLFFPQIKVSDSAASSGPLRLAQLPLFPLQAVLFPQGQLPLRVFEVRYLDLMRRCHAAGAPFGIVGLRQGGEVRSADPQQPPEAFLPIGTLAIIEDMRQPQAGLLHVRCRGTQRFELESTQLLKHGLWVADVTLRPNDPSRDIPSDLMSTSNALQHVLTNLHAQYHEGQHIPIQAPYHWHDAGWVANRWCELLPIPLELKQRLMALDSPLVRLELVSDMLDKLKLKGT